MSLSLANADIYISRIIGGAGDTAIKAQAREALGQAMEVLLHRHSWAFLRLDTSNSFAVASSAGSGSATLTTAVTNGFKNVLVGMTATHANIPADTTVLSIESNTSLTLSAVTTGIISAASVTFGGTIPIQEGTATYTLPALFWKPYTCRLVTNLKNPLVYIPHNNLDALTYDQSIAGKVTHYTIYNSAAFDSNGTQQTKIKFFRVPDQADTALLKYYRQFDVTDDPVDIPDAYLYLLLDTARIKLLEAKNATDRRLPALMQDIEFRTRRAIAADKEEGGDDQWEGIHTPIELGQSRMFDGVFYPHGDEVWRGM